MGQIPERDASGRTITRTAITQNGWAFQMCNFEFETSQLNSPYMKDFTDTTVPGLTLKCYDSSDVELTTQISCDTNAVKTVVDLELQYDFDIIGGSLYQKAVPVSDIRLWCVAVPDIPAASGGEKEMIRGFNLTYLPALASLDLDGKATLKMVYDAENHTNKKRFILRHSAGYKHKLLATFKIYKG